MHELPLLINIAVALVVAFIGGLIARRLGLPSVAGYLLAGIAIGPFSPGFTGDSDTIGQLAELGVIFLMFGVGLHFSLHHLWQVRNIAVPGAATQMVLITLAAVAITRLWGWSLSAGILLGLATSIASTVVLLRGLIDNSLLNTVHGQAAVGWLVLEDIISVLLLLLLPVLAVGSGGLDWGAIGFRLVKAAAFIALMFLVGARLFPWLLQRIAHTRSHELFILAILAVALGTAMGASQLFGVSLALGAFLAGVIVSESPLSHQVGADILPFRDAFAVLFFVSVGMLVDPRYLWQHIGQVLALVALIMIAKPLFTLLVGFFIDRPARTMLVVAAGLSQIGEFSFILGQAGLAQGIFNRDQYSLILAGALISITLNPFMWRLIYPAESLLQRWPALWRRLNRHGPAPAPVEAGLRDHMVLVGCGRVGGQLREVAGTLGIPLLVIDNDMERVEQLNKLGVATLYGDAANSEVLTNAGLDRARALVVTAPEQAAAEMVVAAGRILAPGLPIIARASTVDGIQRLTDLGAQAVIHAEMEGGLEIIRHTLEHLGFPEREVYRFTDAVRHDRYQVEPADREQHRLLDDLLGAVDTMELTWFRLHEGSPLVDKSLAEANLRACTGASVVAILRDGQLVANPKSSTRFEAGDRMGCIGEAEQLARVERLAGGTDGAESIGQGAHCLF